MPIIKSAKKRVRTAEKAAIANSKTRKSVRKAIKALEQALKDGEKKKLSELYSKAQSSLDTAVKKNVMHKNKAARKKSKLSNELKAAGASLKTSPNKPATKKATTTKAKPAKTATEKTTTAKKPALKKSTK